MREYAVGLIRRTLTAAIASTVIAITLFLADARADGQSINGKRVALVIGIGDYAATTKLANPPNDAKLIATRLKAAGFQLVGDGPALNLTRDGFEHVLNDFSALAADSDVALFYYAGHGMELLSTNWLLPVTAAPKKQTDLPGQAVDLADVMKRMERSGAKFKLVLLDACRDNPFAMLGVRGGGGGLMRVDAPDGTLISYATKPGSVAQDGDGADSPYSTALAMLLGQPGVPVLSMFNQLGVAVKHMTGDNQQPWMSASPLEKEFMFVPANAIAGMKDDALGLSLGPSAADRPRAQVGGETRDAGDASAAADTMPQVWDYIDTTMQLQHDVDLFALPEDGASALTMLRAGSSAFIVGLIVGNEWVEIRPSDTEVGFVPISKIPEINNPDALAKPAQPSAPKPVYAAPPPAQAPAIAGHPIVHDTATLLIDDKVVPLSGIEGYGGAFVDGLGQYIAMNGDFVSCKPADPGRYTCLTRDNTDVALAAILNGAAKAAPGAPPRYADQQRTAQERKRGIWSLSTTPPPKPDRLKATAVYAAGAPAPSYVTRSFAPVADGMQPPGSDPSDVAVTTPFESDYGVVEIDGQPMTVIDGERVVIIQEDDGGWVFRDRRGEFRPPPAAVYHDLNHFYRAHPIPATATAAFVRQHVAMSNAGPGVMPQHLSRPGMAPGVAQTPRFGQGTRSPAAFAAPPPVARPTPQPFVQRASVPGLVPGPTFPHPMQAAGLVPGPAFPRPMQAAGLAPRPGVQMPARAAVAPAKVCKKSC
jgi:hypothetical protein